LGNKMLSLVNNVLSVLFVDSLLFSDKVTRNNV